MSLATLVLAATLNPGGPIAWIVIGLLAGWLAGVIMPGRGFGLVGDLIIGLVGAFLGGLIMNLLAPDQTFGFWGSLLVAFPSSRCSPIRPSAGSRRVSPCSGTLS